MKFMNMVIYKNLLFYLEPVSVRGVPVKKLSPWESISSVCTTTVGSIRVDTRFRP